MADAIGIGITHYPMLATEDGHMANLMRMVLKDPDIPADRKDPANWSEQARREWADDEGAAAAGEHRAKLLAGLAKTREALDEFNPDLLIVWGDDQYENFREEVIPPFCVLAYQTSEVEAFAVNKMLTLPPPPGADSLDLTFQMQGDPTFAKQLVADVGRQGIDIAYSYEQRKGVHFPHAFANTQVFLDWANFGQKFPYPIVPIAVNCYGEHVIARKGGIARFADIQVGEDLDPPGPSPKRCFELGAAVARSVRASGKRVALVASSSWSHAFLHDKDWHLRPDTEADRALYDAMVAEDYDTWNATTTGDVVSAGQHEMLNWFCLLGAMSELGMTLEWSEFVDTEVLNSNKVFAIFK
ncbi:extradiol ring-cleavage dioxygenase [Nocardia vinacea]|uniref:Extradiol ring-cleavage dioxygenase n=1 Tax=Nocardia vinacea TaxID=96468 RepID=A0ABZ1YUE1_9NOCA|nr:extradiol ring-cleavage dioxygenase [Nocardia vinacea]